MPDESKRSSTGHELIAVRLVLEALAAKLENERVKWFTNNQNVVCILSVGNKKPDLQDEALDIISTLLAYCVHIEPEWIPRRDNEVADYLSRLVDYDDWSLDHVSFMELDRVCPPTHTQWIALQAITIHSCHILILGFRIQAQRMWMLSLATGKRTTTGFAHLYTYLVPSVIRHLLKCKVAATLIVPEWPPALFWPRLFSEGGKLASFIAETRTLTPATLTITPGRRGSSLFVGYPNTNLLALCIS